MNIEEIMYTAEHLRLDTPSDEKLIQFYILQTLASIAVNLQRIADTMHEVHLENQQA